MNPWREGARGVLRSSTKPENRPTFCHRRGIENFCRLFSTQQCPNVFVSDVGPAPATYHRGVCEHCDQTVGRSPSRARPVQISWRSRWFCRSMSVLDSESHHSNKHLAEYFSGRSWPKIGPGMFLWGVYEKFDTFFFEDLCSLRAMHKSFGGYIRNSNF